MRILLHSVPGTGTRFVADILETVFGCQGISFRDLIKGTTAGNVYALIHVHDTSYAHPTYAKGVTKYQEYMSWIPNGVRMVTPLRNPCLQYFTREEEMPKTVGRWESLIAQEGKHHNIYFPVDTRLDRSMLLNRLRKHLDADDWHVGRWQEIMAFWGVVGSNGKTAQKTEYLGTGKVAGLDLTPLQFAVDWYQSKIKEN